MENYMQSKLPLVLETTLSVVAIFIREILLFKAFKKKQKTSKTEHENYMGKNENKSCIYVNYTSIVLSVNQTLS